jgi:glycosyltransferase involved in cell wall biosynthesis
MGYQMPIFKEYVKNNANEVHVIHWDKKKLTPYIPKLINGVSYYNRSTFSKLSLKEFIENLKPDIVFISGWMDLGYLVAIRPLIKKGIPIVTGFDDIWFSTIKQRLASLFFPIVKRFFFTHAWVTGPMQFEYAKKLGFQNIDIIYNLYCADNKLFESAYQESIYEKKKKYPHQFLFVGRFEHVKGVDLLIEAWDNIINNRKDWQLCLIGNGSFYDEISCNKSIKIIDFLQPERLNEEIANSGCFILPSRFEPWALVLQEFSLAGLPILCTNVCGAASTFVIPDYNGYTFDSKSIKDLEKAMLKIINLTDEKLIDMSEKSNLIGKRITPEISAACFLSIIEN